MLAPWSRRAGRTAAPLALLAVLLVAGCGGEPRLSPRPDAGAEAIRVWVDHRVSRPTRDASAPRLLYSPVSRRPVFRFEILDRRAIGNFDAAELWVAAVRPDGRPEERFWFEEIGTRGATLRPGVPIHLARPAERTLKIATPSGLRAEEFHFYPGNRYEVGITVLGHRGRATQTIHFSVSR